MRPSATAEKSMPLSSQARPPVGPSNGPAIFANVQATPTVPESYVSRSEVSLGPISSCGSFKTALDLGEHAADVFQRPLELRAVDHQGRSDAHDGVVGIPGKDSARKQPHDHLARACPSRVDIDAAE